jgi:hypothetical protein
MEKRKKKSIEIQESIRQILFYDWDPIGINDLAPDDEYDSYVGGIYRLLVPVLPSIKSSSIFISLKLPKWK